MPQDDLRKKAGDRKNMVKTAGTMLREGVNEAANEMIKYKLQKKVDNKIKRPDTPLAPTPEPKRK
jgi:predicted DNA-binding protein